MGALRDDRDANDILMEDGEEDLRAMLDGAIKTPGKKKPKERTPEEKLKAVDELLRNGIEDDAAREEKRQAAMQDFLAATRLHMRGEIDAATLAEKERAYNAAWGFDCDDDPKPTEDPGKTDETPLDDGEASNGQDTGEPPPNEGNGEHDENGDRFNEVPPNDGETSSTASGQGAKSESSEHLLQYSFYTPKPEKLIAAKQFLCVNSRHHVRKFTSGTVSPGGVGKTFLIFGEGLAYLTGKALLGIEPVAPINVCIWCEDPMEELEARFAAAMKLHGLTERDLKARLVLMSARQDEMIIAREVRGQTVIITPVVDNVIRQMKEFDIGIKFIDPFVKTHALKENDNVSMDIAAKQWNRVAEETGRSYHPYPQAGRRR